MIDTHTLMHIATIYLTIGGFIALMLNVSEYEVPFWNAVLIGVLYPFLIIAAVFGSIYSAFADFFNGK